MLEAEEIIRIHVKCEQSLEVKNDGTGFLRVIPILGGYFEGKVNGVIISGGADWNSTRESGVSHVFAKYVLKTEEGEYIAIENEGKIDIKKEETRIKTVPTFCVDQNSKYSWLNSGVYVGALDAGGNEEEVEIVIYKLK